ncbi:hypothetical protein LINPERHAP1_LOCUS19631 [Linum perenne]
MDMEESRGEFGVYSDFGIHYMRLNDLSSWPRHKVDLATTNVWSRLELKYSLPKHKNTSQRPTVGDDMSKEKYAELEKPVKEPKEAREKLSSNVAQMKKELEECKKKSWAILPSTKLLPLSLDTKDKYSYQPSISVFA